jgi:pSer/pThr/pTyr-binding forkhead associated (FHA) protein
MNNQDSGKETLRIDKVRIVTTDRDDVVREYIFDQELITIGSATDCDLILDDSRVSRHHCRIIKDVDGYILKDEGSTNGTILNGVKIKEAYLESGGRIPAEITTEISRQLSPGFALGAALPGNGSFSDGGKNPGADP